MLQIHVEQRTAYGETRFYPMNALAEAWLALLQKRTFTRRMLAEIVQLDSSISIQVTQPAPDQFVRSVAAPAIAGA